MISAGSIAIAIAISIPRELDDSESYHIQNSPTIRQSDNPTIRNGKCLPDNRSLIAI